MILPVVLVVAAWIVLSVPAALVVGRMFAAGHVVPAMAGRAVAADVGRVAYLSRIESRRVALAARGPHAVRLAAGTRHRVRGRWSGRRLTAPPR